MAKGSGKVKVLFVCVGNMVRSQMAEGFARSRGSAFMEIYSAGVRHTGEMSHEAMLVMSEKGIDISRQYSKGLADVPIGEMDYIVNMSAYSNDAAFPAALPATIITWEVSDPLGGSLDRFRRTRDLIEAKVEEFMRMIWAGGSPKKEGR
jgi:arsenate reductase